MLRPLVIAALFVAAPAVARNDVPLSPVGLSFGAGTPQRVAPTHPLFGAVAVAGVEALPEKLGPAKRASFVAALNDTLDKLGMLATDPAKARYRLTPVWVGMESPFKISIKSKATVWLNWQVTRIADGRSLFAREIATSAESSGGSAAERKKGVERIALMTNIASVAGCIDQAAQGRPPAECALAPGFRYQAPSPPLIVFMPR